MIIGGSMPKDIEIKSRDLAELSALISEYGALKLMRWLVSYMSGEVIARDATRGDSDYMQAEGTVPMTSMATTDHGIVEHDWHGARYVQIEVPEGLPQAEYIVRMLLPSWYARFIAKNKTYASVDQSLGPRGVFPDINRKVGILKKRIWEQNFAQEDPSEGEATTEVIEDLIGHLFLMYWHITEGMMTEKSNGLPRYEDFD